MALNRISVVIDGDSSGAEGAFRRTGSAANQAASEVRGASGRMASATNEAHGGMGRMAAAAGELKGLLGGMAAGFSLAVVIKESLEAALAMERLQKLFTAAAGSASLGGREFEYIRQVSNRLGLEIQNTAESYGKFLASIKGTILEGEKGRRVFESVAESATALGLSTETTNRIFVALQQMMSKGKVSAEELTGQLGESLPGALDMASTAMGVNKAQLLDMMQKGQLMADDLLPRLADQLHATYGQAAVDGANSGQASLNRFKNELFETAATLGNALMPAMQSIMNMVTPMITKLREFIGGIQILAVKAAAALDRNRMGMYGGSKSSDYGRRLAASRQAEEEAIADIVKKHSGTGSSNYTAAEQARQSRNKATAPLGDTKSTSKAARAASQAAQAAEQWRKTYADLQTEIDKLDPAMDEHAQKIADVTNKYTNLMNKKGADITKLQALKTAMLAAIEVRRQMDDAIAQNKTEMSEYSSSSDAMASAEKAHYDSVAATIKAVMDLQPGAAFKALNDQVEAFNAAIAAAPDIEGWGDQIQAAIAKLQADYAESSGTNEMLRDISDMKIDLMDDEFQQQQAILDREYNAKMEAYQKELKLAEKTGKKREDIEEAIALTKQRHDQETAKINDASYKTQLANVATYAGAGAALFSELANAQDQSSRKGFEAAKAFSLAAAIMNTAQAVMVALASPGDIYSNMPMAAVAAAIGAVQVAQIAKTKYGGGGSVVAPSGSFNAGSSASSLGSTSGIGSKIGVQYGSIYDSQTQESLQALAASAESASLAIGKVADGLTSIASLFDDEGSYLSMAVGALPSSKLKYTSMGETVKDTLTDVLLQTSKLSLNPLTLTQDLFTGELFKNLSNAFSGIKKALFGGSWYTKSAGLALSMSGGDVDVDDYLYKKKSGGLFGKNKKKYVYTDDAVWTDIIQTTVDSIASTINHAAVAMGTSSDFSAASLGLTRIKTTGRSESEIAAELQSWLESASNSLAKTVVGLKEYTFYNENAFDALVRLSTALQSTNESFELIGATLIDSTLAGANSTYLLQELMGGAEEFADAIDTYFTSMFTDLQQETMTAAQAARQVNTAFAEMGLAVPGTRAEFAALVNSLDMSAESGAVTFQALVAVSEAFGLVQDHAQLAVESSQDLAERLLAAQGKDDEADLYRLRIDQQEELQEYIEKGLDTTQLLIVQQLEYQNAVKESTSTIVATLTDTALNAAQALVSIMSGSLSTMSPEAQYRSAQASWAAALANGKTDQYAELGEALLNASKTYNASSSAYVADYQMVTNALAQVAGMGNNPTLELAQQQVTLLTAIQEATTLQVTATTSLNQLIAQYLTSIGVAVLPGYATGSAYIPYDQTANVHQGEIIIDRQSSDVLRRYGIQVSGSADSGSKEIVAELKSANAKLSSMEQRLSTIEEKARLAANS